MPSKLAAISEEFEGAEFGDARLAARAKRLAEDLAARPDEPLPDVFQTEAGLEAAYRFLKNRRVTAQAIVAPHVEATRAACRQAARVLVIHDTTTFHFNGRGFGPLRGASSGEGFFAHMALALDEAPTRAPLGLLGWRTFERQARPKGLRKTAEERQADNERRHWEELFNEVHESLGEVRAVHVMDRQADCYALLSSMHGQSDFVVRAAHDRLVEDGQRVRSLLEHKPVMLERCVPISSRSGPGWNRSRHQPKREEREARLEITAATTVMPRPESTVTLSTATTVAEIKVNVVRVAEVNAPEGEQAVEWMLWTTLPVETTEQVAEVVDIYRARWTIEELFKAIKTGCAYEERRLESRDGLLNLLAITVPVACRLLRLRYLARHSPEVSAKQALSPSQLAVMAAIPRAGLKPNPTVRDALLAVARLGGHLRRNGEPGWQVLTRGYHELLMLEAGWLAARSSPDEM